MPTLFPFSHNWSSPYTTTYEFSTDILTSRNGTEQRRARRETARKGFQTSLLVDGPRLTLFDRVMFTSQNQELYFAEEPRGFTTYGLAASGVTTTFVTEADHPAAWVVEGAVVGLIDDIRVGLRTIDSVVVETVGDVTTYHVDFLESEITSWPIGTRVCPLRAGYLNDDTAVTFRTSTVATASLDFDVTPASEDNDAPETDWLNTWGGREVFRWKGNWGTPPSANYRAPRETVDYGQGVTATFRPIVFATRVLQASYLSDTLAQGEELRTFFCRMKGQRGEFYMPTWQPDMTPLSDLDSWDTSVTVAGTDIVAYFSDDPIRRAFAFVYKTGDMVFRKIVEITEDGGNSVIEFEPPTPWPIAAADLRCLSWLSVYRFASDTMTIEFLTESVSRTQLSVSSLPDLAPEGIDEVFDEGQQWILDTFGWAFISAIYDPLDEFVNEIYPLSAEVE